MDYVIGIDGGGTSTACLLADLTGRTLAQVEAPASNHLKGDLRGARSALGAGLSALLARAGLSDVGSHRAAALCAGLSGVDTDEDVELFRQVFASIVTTDHLLILNDGEVALYGALEDEPGVLVISGTGSIVWATAADGRRRRVGGWDYLLGDEGSGYSIGLRTLRAVAASHDQRLPATSLTGAVLAAFGVATFAELLRVVYDGTITPCRIAALAPLANAAAGGGDEVAAAVIDDSVAELVRLTLAAVGLSGLSGKSFPIVAQGGVLRAPGQFATRYREALRALEPDAYFVEPRRAPAEGAVLLGLRLLRQ